MIDLSGAHWVDVGAWLILASSLLVALALAWRGRGRTARGQPGKLLDVASAELEGQRLLRHGLEAIREQDESRAEALFKGARARFRSARAPMLEAQARYQLALLYWKWGQAVQAAETLQPIVRLGSGEPRHHLVLAQLWEGLGRTEQAAEALETAAERCGSIRGLQGWIARLNGKAAPGDKVGGSEAAKRTDRNGLDEAAQMALHRLGGEVALLANLAPADLAMVTGLSDDRASQVVQAARRDLNLD